MIDYGAVVFKNGKHINKEMFMDMLEAVGWVDKPRLRYEDCDHLCCGRSSCGDCPRANYKTVNFGYGDVKSFESDCRGSAKLGRGIDGNYYAYIGDKHLTLCFYKKWVVIVLDGVVLDSVYGCNETSSTSRYSLWGKINERDGKNGLPVWDAEYHVKYLGKGVYLLSMKYNGDSYHVIYGYGIDVSKKTWDRVKATYVGKRVAKKVDKLYERFGGLIRG